MTSKRRKYGDLSASPRPSSDPDIINDVFAAFTGKRPSDHPPPETPAPRAAPAQETTAAQPTPAARERSLPLHDAAAVQHAAPARETGVAGYTRVSNDLLDRILPTLDTYDQSVLVRLYRLSRGFNSDTCRVSAPTLARACNVSERQVRKSVAKLEARGLVERVGQDFGNRDKSLRGTTFRILIADPTPARSATPARHAAPAHGAAAARDAANKVKALKENSKEVSRLTPDEIQIKIAETVEALRGGEKIEDISSRLAPTLHVADLQLIRSAAQAQVQFSKSEEGK